MNNSVNKSHKSKSPIVQPIHSIKGRARYKVTGLRGSVALKQYVEFRLAAEVGINRVSASSDSGNVLVLFDAKYTVGEIAARLKRTVTDYCAQRKKTGNVNPPGKHRNKLIPDIQWLASRSMEEQSKSWHLLDAETIITDLQTSPDDGLSSELAQRNLKRYGANILPEAAPRSKLGMFIDQFKSLPVALLSVAAGISVLTGGLADAVVILGVVTINAAIGYATESQSDRIIRSLKHLVKPSATLIRDRRLQDINAEEIALGDVLVLRPGTYIPADARVIEAKHLSVDESALTGESLPVSKVPERLTNSDVPLGDRINMVYMGTLVTGGQGLAIVVATGQTTEMGKIQTLVGEAALPETPMERQLDQAGSQLVLISGAVCGIVFGIGLLRGYGFLQMLKTSISLAVAAVPEGLPTVATTTLALGIRDMRKQKVLIRRLDAVEALGSVQSLCLDKTGTLTANTMSVVELYTDSSRLQVQEGHFLNGKRTLHSDTSEQLQKLIQVGVLCNECEINGDGTHCAVQGSSTESALVNLAIDAGINVPQLREQLPLIKIQHRSEERNFMLTLHNNGHEKKFVAVKGNPIEVLALCSWQLIDGRISPLTQARRAAIEAENERMAGKGLRVLGAAYGHTDELEVNAEDNLVWLGLVGMADPIRKGVKEVMGVFHEAEIDTVMVTGDQSPTAYAIGKELNLSRGDQLKILDSTDLTNLDPDVMRSLCDRVHVFARISPAHKLQIVQALQQAGKVVAMTGDGINDAPALKAAEVGIAMGNTGTDVAREVADVVLEDDNLETMTIAVSQGRTIYNNIRKSVHFLLSTNLSEIMVMLAATSLGIGQPLNAMQLLWLNLVTDIFPGLALALEPPEPDVLSQPPRDPKEPLIQTADFQRIAFESSMLSASALGAYGYGILRYGISPQSSTIGFMSLTLAQLLHALSCRSKTHRIFGSDHLPPNRYLAIALGGSIALQLLCAIVPGLRQLLKIAPIGVLDAAVIGNSAILPLLINEATKTTRRRTS
jgi:Ca2+-transporting ATPase